MWCRGVSLTMRCQLECCRINYCDVEGAAPLSPFFLGLSILQIGGVVIGALALLSAVSAIMLLLVKRLSPILGSLRAQSQDTQVLVEDGPDNADCFDIDSESEGENG